MKRKTFLKKKRKHFYGNLKFELKYLRPFNENLELSYNLFYKNFIYKNFIFYKFFLRSLKKTFNLYYINLLFKYINNVHFVLPLFILKKQFFAKNIEFFNFLKFNKINGFFFYKNFINFNYNFFKNYNQIIKQSNYTYLLINLKNDDLLKLNLINEVDSKKIYFFIKNKFDSFEKVFIYKNFNFDFFILLNIDFYKIINLLIFLKINN